jgi:outer membrane protein TolC
VRPRISTITESSHEAPCIQSRAIARRTGAGWLRQHLARRTARRRGQTYRRQAARGRTVPSPDAQALQDAQTQIADWLKTPVDADTAVRIALLNNPGLQAQLAQLGIADAQRVQVLTLPNPSFTFGRFRNGHEREIERQLSFGWCSSSPALAQPLAGWQMEQATLTAAQQVLLLASDTPRVAARRGRRAGSGRQRTHARGRGLGGELARRMAQVGNFSKMDQARELAQQQQASAQLARARLNAQLEREQLARRMGLWGEQLAYKLPAQLPACRKQPNCAAAMTPKPPPCASGWIWALCAATWM